LSNENISRIRRIDISKLRVELAAGKVSNKVGISALSFSLSDLGKDLKENIQELLAPSTHEPKFNLGICWDKVE